MEVGEVYIVAETGMFFQLRGLHDDYCIISNHTRFYDDAKTTKLGGVQVSYNYIESAVKVTTVDTIPGMFHNGIGWKHVMTEKDPANPRIYRIL